MGLKGISERVYGHYRSTHSGLRVHFGVLRQNYNLAFLMGLTLIKAKDAFPTMTQYSQVEPVRTSGTDIRALGFIYIYTYTYIHINTYIYMWYRL